MCKPLCHRAFFSGTSGTDLTYSPLMNIEILPSLLAADFGNLEAEARKAEALGGDQLHLDIMDGHFAPNLSMGPDVVMMANRCVKIPLNVHLMISNPDQFVAEFADAGANTILIHAEAECNVPEVLEHMRELGVKPGVTISPETPAEIIFPVIGLVDQVLCMTVHPGYGGQSFMPEVLPKIRAMRDYANAQDKKDLDIMVDGGINIETTAQCAEAGANFFVAGTFLFRAPDMESKLAAMREAATNAFRGE